MNVIGHGLSNSHKKTNVIERLGIMNAIDRLGIIYVIDSLGISVIK